jgi:two-component system, LytTR family, sensor kinase
MQHPILKNRRSVLIYSLIWLVFATGDATLVYLKFQFSLHDCIIASFVNNGLFALLGIAIWYAVLYSFPEKIGALNLIINHLAAASVMVFIWSSSTMLIIRLITDEIFYGFLSKQIYWHVTMGVCYYSVFVLIYYIIIYRYNLKEKRKNEDKLMAIIKEAELNLLKSQINPHFLFNSLNSISSLTITNPSKAQEMIIKLSDFLRYSISGNSNQKSSLKVELENLQRYLDIEKTRFGDKLNYQADISANCLEKTLPVMILQPLYENAIKHGVYESTEPVTLKVIGRCENDYLSLTISNNFDPESHSKKGAGIGLKNIRERLRLTYHNDRLIQTVNHNNIFEVSLLIPQND